MTKDSRLSYRITDQTDDEVERIIIKDRSIRDRSDLGNKSLDFYFKLLRRVDLEEKAYINVVLKIAKKFKVEDHPDILELKNMYRWFDKISKNPIRQAKMIRDKNLEMQKQKLLESEQ